MEYSGLINFGNTCYLNVIIQALRYTPEFFEIIKKNVDKNNHNLLYRFFKILEQMNSSNITVKPTNLLETIKKYYSDYNILQQQDTQEFLLKIINSINDDIKNNDINNLFQNKLLIQFKCNNCHQITTANENFLMLPITIPNQTDIFNLDITKLFLTEKVDYACDKCNVKSSAIKNTIIKQTAKILVFHLLRFDIINNNIFKIKTPVKYPKYVTFNGFKYQLYAYINHLGRSPQYGHYIINCFDFLNNDWSEYNDDDVYDTNLDEVYSPNNDAYLLFYKLI